MLPLVALLLVSCAPDDALDHDLGPGATGDDVRALHAALTERGYFPNPQLASAYPSWRPIVSTPPARLDAYDDRTTTAVRSFQMSRQLPSTGIVDQPTRRSLRTPDCGVPDGLRRPDPREKFLLEGSAWNQTSLTWFYIGGGEDGISKAQIRAAIKRAFDTWQAATNLTFTETFDSAASNVDIFFDDFGSSPNLAQASFPDSPGNHTIVFNPAYTWSVSDEPIPSDQADFETTMLHEIGHWLGLHHSSVGSRTTTVMHPKEFTDGMNVKTRALGTDDKLAIGILYNPFVFETNICARDVGVAGSGTTETVWIVDCLARVLKRNGASWTLDTSAPPNAAAIAVQPNGRPWIVLENGEIRRKSSNSPTSGSWAVIPGCARDVGVGGTSGSGTTWIIGCGSPNGDAFLFNGTAFEKDAPPGLPAGAGTRIAVDSSGTPFLVNSFGNVYRRSSPVRTSGSWNVLDAGFNSAVDIGAHRSSTFVWAWTLGGGVPATFVWNEQPPGGTCGNGGCGAAWWQWDDGVGVRISVGPCGPWVVHHSGSLLHRSKCEGVVGM